LGPGRDSVPRKEVVRSLCRRMGMIPPDLRSKVWPVLLLSEGSTSRCAALASLEGRIRRVHLDLANQAVIEVDVAR